MLARWLSTVWLVLLGEASYGLYLLHVVVYHWYKPRGEALRLPEFGLYLLCCIGLSLLSFRWLETPARLWITRTFKARVVESMEAASDA